MSENANESQMMDCTATNIINVANNDSKIVMNSSNNITSSTSSNTADKIINLALPSQNVNKSSNTPMSRNNLSMPQWRSQPQLQARTQPMIEYYYKNEGYQNQPNCFMFSAFSYPFVPNVGAVGPTNNHQKRDNNCLNYQVINNFQDYRWLVHRESAPYSPGTETALHNYDHEYTESNEKYNVHSKVGAVDAACNVNASSNEVFWCKGDSSPPFIRRQSKQIARQKFSNKMHPVQLLHQLFRKETFVMEYERVNDGPFNQVRVTYKVNGKSYTTEATRLKEARRLCAKQVLSDQFPDLEIELDNDIPEVAYDAAEFDNKHPVQILYQIFRYEPMEMNCEEEGAAHFAKHIFTFSIRGNKYQAKAETIKEAKRRAAILALNDYFKEKGKVPY